MMHNLNFWEEPDWRRESTLNPNFLMAVIIALFIVAVIAVTTFVGRARQQAQVEYDIVSEQLNAIKDDAAQLKTMNTEAELWRSNLEEIQKKSENRIVWSRQLEALQKLVPLEIVFENLEIRAEEVRETLPTDSTAGRPRPIIQINTVYHLFVRGRAIGDNPQRIITKFAEDITENQIIGPELDKYEIQNMTDLATVGDAKISPGKSFVFIAKYKKLDD